MGENTWYSKKDLGHESFFTQYLNSLIFTMNIATTTGYSEQIVYNNAERLLFIIYIYIGDALFAIAFGMISNNVELFPEDYQSIFENIRYI